MGLLGVSLLLLLIIFLLGVFTAGSFFASIPIVGDILALPFQALGFIPTQFWIGFVMLGILAYFLSGNNNGGGGGGGKATGAALVGAGLGAASKFLENTDEDQNHNRSIPDSDDEELDYRRNGGEETEDSFKGENIDLNGDKWQIFLRSLSELNIDPQAQDIILNSIEGETISSVRISILKLTKIYNVINQLTKEEVPNAARILVRKVQDNNYNLSEKTIEGFVESLSREYRPVRTYLSERSKLGNMANSPEHVQKTEQRLEEIIEDINNEEKVIKESVKLEDEAKEELRQALTRYHKDEKLIQGILMLKYEKGETDTLSVGVKAINDVSETIGRDLTEEMPQVIEDLKEIQKLLEDALEKIKEADHNYQQEHQETVNIEKHLSQVEKEELSEVKEAIQVAKDLKQSTMS